MEIPVINRISHFEALNYPSFISQAYHVLSGFHKIYETHSFFKWGAVILTLIASLSTIINRLKILIIRFCQHNCKQSQPLLYDTDFDTDDSDTDSSSDDEPENDEPSISHNRRELHEPAFLVRNSGDEWRNCEGLTGGKSVVKLWDNLSLGFGFESDDVLHLYDVNKGTNAASIFGGLQAISAPFSSPAVFVSAGFDSSYRRVSVGAWDTRIRCRAPAAIVAEWRPKESVTMGDMRMVTEWYDKFWWDADSEEPM